MTNQNGVLKLHFRPTRANLAQLYLVHINVINRIQLDMNMASKFLGKKTLLVFVVKQSNSTAYISVWHSLLCNN
jgi:hypothetical protein